MSRFAIEYFFFALISNLGLFSLVADKSNLELMKVIKHPKISVTLGISTITIAFIWFFGFENRNINDFEGGLDANMQAIFFTMAALASIIILLLLNCVFRKGKSGTKIKRDMDVLRKPTYLESFLQQLKSIWSSICLIINGTKQTVSKTKLSTGLGLSLFLAIGLQMTYLSSSRIAHWSNITNKLNLNSIIAYDESLTLSINGLVGRSSRIDSIMSVFASDYFFPVIFALCLMGIWFSGFGEKNRAINQQGVIFSIISLALVNWIVFVINAYLFRPRPFENHQVNLIFYKATDSSFPSNALAVLFAISIAILIMNRRYGIISIIFSVIYGISRIYVGVHYPLDIISALILGIIAAGIVSYIGRLIYPIPLTVIKLLRVFSLA